MVKNRRDKAEARQVAQDRGISYSEARRRLNVKHPTADAHGTTTPIPPAPVPLAVPGRIAARPGIGAGTNRHQLLLNLAIEGINQAVGLGLIDLSSIEDIQGTLETEIFSRPSMVRWRGIGVGELTITVWWGIKPACKSSECDLPLNKNLGKAIDAACTVWLERKTGRWIQTHKDGVPGMPSSFLSAAGRQALCGVPQVEPQGFNRAGKFFR